jgi:ABC-type bacteriocin/lantibiotic exporter with double-glycine peptidase domain
MFFIDRRISFEHAENGILNIILLSSILGFNFVFRYVRAGMISYILFSVDLSICGGILEKIFKIPAKKMDRKPEAFWHSVFQDIDVIRNGLSGSYIVNLFDIPFVFLFLGTTGILFGRYFFVVLLFLLAYAVFVGFAIYILGVIDDKEKMAVKERDELVAGTIHNLSSLKSLSLADKIKNMWTDYQAGIIDNTYKRNYALDVCLVLSFVIYFLGLAIFSIIGVYAQDTELMSGGTIVAILLLFSYNFYLINDFIKFLPEYFRFINSTERLGQVMTEQVDAIKSDVIEEVTSGELSIKDATLLDNRKNTVLSGASFTFKEGNIYVVRAKSTFDSSLFLRMLSGGYDLESGEVMFDRYSVATVRADSIKDYIHFSPEHYFVIDGTVKENLNCLVSGEDKDSAFEGFVDYRRAAEMLGLSEVAERLANGYNTIIDAKTDLMSAEELKLLSLARSFVGNPRIMLFDQPFAGLSKAHKEGLIRAMEVMSQDRVIIISTLDKDIARKILINIDDGKMTQLTSEAFEGASKDISSRLEAAEEEASANRALFRRIFRKKP